MNKQADQSEIRPTHMTFCTICEKGCEITLMVGNQEECAQVAKRHRLEKKHRASIQAVDTRHCRAL
jgi:hypothetical protein